MHRPGTGRPGLAPRMPAAVVWPVRLTAPPPTLAQGQREHRRPRWVCGGPAMSPHTAPASTVWESVLGGAVEHGGPRNHVHAASIHNQLPFAFQVHLQRPTSPHFHAQRHPLPHPVCQAPLNLTDVGLQFQDLLSYQTWARPCWWPRAYWPQDIRTAGRLLSFPTESSVPGVGPAVAIPPVVPIVHLVPVVPGCL